MANKRSTDAFSAGLAQFGSSAARQLAAMEEQRRRQPKKQFTIDGAIKEGVGYGLGALGAVYGGPGGFMAGKAAGEGIVGAVEQTGRGDILGGVTGVAAGLPQAQAVVSPTTYRPAEAGGQARHGEQTSRFVPTPQELTPARRIQPRGDIMSAAGGAAMQTGSGVVGGEGPTGSASERGLMQGANPLTAMLGAVQMGAGGPAPGLPSAVGTDERLTQDQVADLIAVLAS